MKKQINPTIKAYLIRGAFYLLLLLAVCAIPFALAQRNATKRTTVNPAAKMDAKYMAQVSQRTDGAVSDQPLPKTSGTGPSQIPTTSNTVTAGPPIFVPITPRMPAQPNVVLYDQINNPAPTPGGVTSQDFEAAFDTFDSFAADDFVVPGGQTWNITEVDVAGEYGNGPGPAASFHVFFYTDSATLPGTLVATRLANPFSGGANALITLTTPVTLTAGTYWVVVQAREDLATGGQWFWDNRTVTSNSGAAWQNPGGGFAVCPTWGRKTTCLPTQNGPDQLFRLVGTVGGGSPTPTPTGTPCNAPYIVTQIGGSIVPGTTDIGNHGDDTVTPVALPFPFTLYDQSFTSINLSSNGNAQFVTTDTTFTNQCLPWTTHNYTIYPYWDDLYLVNTGFGIFTSISGTAPNRIFNIEWRAQYFPGSGTASFELRLYEGQTRFDIIYGTVDSGNTSATAGVQKNDTTFTQYFCNGVGGAATGGQS
jgi:hypothetical protein